MKNTTTIPTSLKVVAFLFLLSGILSLVEVVTSGSTRSGHRRGLVATPVGRRPRPRLPGPPL
jgi:hypothetical protein